MLRKKVTNFISDFKEKFLPLLDSKEFEPFFFFFLLVMSFKIKDDTDFYFLIENGKKIITDGQFPHVDWMSMHEGLHIVIQQWVVSVIDYIVYNAFGMIGIFIFFALIYQLFFWLLYKVFMYVSNGAYLRSYITTFAIASLTMVNFGNARPQIFSAIFVALAISVMERHKDKNHKTWFVILPMLGIALLQANFHSTFFMAIIGVYGAYAIFNSISKKKPDWPVIVGIPLSIGIGLINPYGYEALLHPLYARGYPLYRWIGELAPIRGVEMVLFLLIPTIVVVVELTRNKMTIAKQGAIGFLVLATTIATISATRSQLFNFITVGTFVATYGSNDKKYTLSDNSSLMSIKDKVATYIICTVLIAGSVFISWQDFPIEKKFPSLTGLKDMIADVESQGYVLKDKSILITNIADGQYLYHYAGMRPFNDGRLETFVDSLNKKHDYSTEFYNVIMGNQDAKEFVDIYKFDYIYAHDPVYSASMKDFLGSGEYELIYTTNTSDKYQLYIRADLAK